MQDQICTFVVYIQSWTNTQHLTSTSCQLKKLVSEVGWINPCKDPTVVGGHSLVRGRDTLTGGWSNALVTDPEIQDASRTAISMYGESMSSSVALRLLNVLQAQEQVLAFAVLAVCLNQLKYN